MIKNWSKNDQKMINYKMIFNDYRLINEMIRNKKISKTLIYIKNLILKLIIFIMFQKLHEKG